MRWLILKTRIKVIQKQRRILEQPETAHARSTGRPECTHTTPATCLPARTKGYQCTSGEISNIPIEPRFFAAHQSFKVHASKQNSEHTGRQRPPVPTRISQFIQHPLPFTTLDSFGRFRLPNTKETKGSVC